MSRSSIFTDKTTNCKKAAGKGSSDNVFQVNDINGNGTQPSSKRNSIAAASTPIQSPNLPSPLIKNGKCSRCKMSDRVGEEVISCSICSHLFHAVCRDSRGNYDTSAISTKSFYI